MKTFKKLLSVILCLATVTAFSQKTDQSAPKLFAAFPETIQLSKNILHSTINASEGEQVIVAFSNEFRFKGTVLSNLQKYDNLQSVMIKSASFGNSIFQLSKITNEDKSISYTGRIINPDAFDGYEIKKDNKDNYSFIKFETRHKIEDCSN